VYTSAVWNVKSGNEDAFAREWQASVDRMSPNLSGVTFRLFRQRESPSRFVSVAGPWRGLEQWESLRSSEQFQESIAAMEELLESYDVGSYDLVAEVS
jgi:quinol monooxygenase YgiN